MPWTVERDLPRALFEQRPWVELVKALQVILVISQVGASEAWRVDVTRCAPLWPARGTVASTWHCGHHLPAGVPQTFPGRGSAPFFF